jgi:hypothetical protein
MMSRYPNKLFLFSPLSSSDSRARVPLPPLR